MGHFSQAKGLEVESDDAANMHVNCDAFGLPIWESKRQSSAESGIAKLLNTCLDSNMSLNRLVQTIMDSDGLSRRIFWHIETHDFIVTACLSMDLTVSPSHSMSRVHDFLCWKCL